MLPDEDGWLFSHKGCDTDEVLSMPQVVVCEKNNGTSDLLALFFALTKSLCLILLACALIADSFPLTMLNSELQSA